LSEKQIRYIENHPSQGVKWYNINGINVQGSWEKKFAEYLTENNIHWERKRLVYQKYRQYTPDFYCKDFNCYFEIKGFLRDRDLYKMYLVLDEYPDLNIKMITEEYIDRIESSNVFSLPNFQNVYPRESIDESKFINAWKGETKKKEKKIEKERITKIQSIKLCSCGKKIKGQNKLCRSCYNSSLQRLTQGQIQYILDNAGRIPAIKIAKEIGVSDKTIAKIIKNGGYK
jgi:hypothetical protein